MNKINLNYFDVIGYLNSRGVPYATEGKNISTRGNWIGIQCLWCADHSNHLGINLDHKTINCWMCPAKGTVIKLIMTIDQCGYERAASTVQEFSDVRLYAESKRQGEDEVRERINKVKLDKYIKDELMTVHAKWLALRRFDPEWIFREYNLLCCGPVGRWSNRIIIPFHQRGRLITYTTRDVTDKAKVPYVHLPNEESTVPIKETLYNIETMEDTVIVVEGPTDVWRLGKSVVATMGYKYTPIQLVALVKARRIFIMFDTETWAQEVAMNLAKDLSTVVSHVENVCLPEGDPGDLSEDDVKHIRKELFGRIY